MGILLDSFKIETFCYLFWAKGANVHFGQDSSDYWLGGQSFKT